MHIAKPIWRAALWIYCVVASSQLLCAQTNFNVRLWQSEDGLPNNIVQAISQTADGYLWVGTREGLVRFDGDQFHLTELLPESPQPSVLCLLGSRDGSLWIGTDYSGIFHLSGGSLTRCGIDGDDNNFSVYGIQESSDGTIWFGTSRGFLSWSDGKIEKKGESKNGNQPFCADNTGKIWTLDNGLRRMDSAREAKYNLISGTWPRFARSLYCDADGVFWIGSDTRPANSLIRVKDGIATRFSRKGGPSGFVSVIFKDDQGEIWVGSYSGLSRLINGQFVSFSSSDISSYRIYSIFEDKEKNIWIGSEEGLNRLTPERFKTITTRNGLSLNTVVSVCPSQDGGVWISSWGGGINHYLDGDITHLTMTNRLASNYILAMTEASDGSLWAGSDYGGPLQRIKGNEITIYDSTKGFIVYPENATIALCEGKNGVLWIGNRDGLQTWDGTNFNRFTTRDGLCNNTINAICRGVGGEMWLGTASGLTQWKDGRFINYAAKDSSLNVMILSLYLDAQKTLWIGTKGRGLLTLRDGAVHDFTGECGLLSDSIYSILEDNHTNLWLNSSRGIFRVNKNQIESVAEGKAKKVISIGYGKADGILASGQFRDVTQPASCKDSHGRLWFRTTQGVVTVDPDVIAVDHQPPPVEIQKIIANGKSLAVGSLGAKIPDSVIVPPGRGELDIQYVALSYTEPERNMYRYKLDGVNPGWVNIGNYRVAKYNNLRPGRYRFQVTACNNDGIWNPMGKSVEIVMEPHFWQTWWFYSLCGMVAIGIVGGLTRYVTHRRMQKKLFELEQQRAVEQERTRIARDVHDELGAKLTHISFQGGIATCSLDDPIEAKKLIDQMSISAREAVSSLREIIWSADPKNDSLEGLVGHISHYAEEFFNACLIRCEVVAPEHLPSRHISAAIRHNLFLAIKEAINNAAKHAGATRVLIEVSVRMNELEIMVSDNGCGLESEVLNDAMRGSAQFGQHGLINMYERLRSIQGRCDITSKKGHGTSVHFIIPLDDGGD